MNPNELTRQIIGAAIAVHRELGPGKPEAAYEAALAIELALCNLSHFSQKPVPVIYKGIKLECGYRLDLLVGGIVVVEVKAVELLNPVHRAQVLTYLKLGGWKIALLFNFNVAVLKEGIERFVLGLEEEGDRTTDGDETAEARRTQRGLTIPPAVMTPFMFRDASGDPETEQLAADVVDAAMEVHRELGPGLLQSAYATCLCHELRFRGVPFERKRSLPLVYKRTPLPEPDEVELLVGGKVVVHPRGLSALQPVHEAELLSQLRLGGWGLGLVINFNSVALRDGLRRMVLSRAR